MLLLFSEAVIKEMKGTERVRFLPTNRILNHSLETDLPWKDLQQLQYILPAVSNRHYPEAYSVTLQEEPEVKNI